MTSALPPSQTPFNHELIAFNLKTKSIVSRKTLSSTVKDVKSLSTVLDQSLWNIHSVSVPGVGNFKPDSPINLSSISVLTPSSSRIYWIISVSPRPPPFVRPTPRPSSEHMTVFVKSLSGKTLSIECSKDDVVAEVKWQVFGITGIPPDLQRLMYCGNRLEDGVTLRACHVESESLFHLMLRLRGGSLVGTEFVDVAKNVPKSLGFCMGPKWRVAGYGLNVEGICKNVECVAYCEHVISPQGVGMFDIHVNAKESCCPMCRHTVTPAECGFYNCEYRFAGLKIDFWSNKVTKFNSEWAVASLVDNYVHFSKTRNGVATWGSLVIETRRMGVKRVNKCMICLDELGVEDTTVKCVGCQFCVHPKCGLQWRYYVDKKCPGCMSEGMLENLPLA
ncbi:hypothetical protein BCR33DRAFT_769215 [Rhizoclosmatium globosum]|uniref:Ubiquitin-like domain-containing protein n=1 Tax=Rhizoclosmatium globosum TaxID=329046 RepID=A0A1Y2BUJ7_9FUNG|nr:hypothetical protein BCR33DRAFT_769215 [Rhizoclosmatium globosum]|eukprot:ORY38413.1 hypothetical protein BCR33DRAFT_769215 [Rhizoclosmatium globosum]